MSPPRQSLTGEQVYRKLDFILLTGMLVNCMQVLCNLEAPIDYSTAIKRRGFYPFRKGLPKPCLPP